MNEPHQTVNTDHPRRFYLHRTADPSGISGTGRVADGVQWTDGTVAIHWRGPTPSHVHWNTIQDAVTVHSHGGLTRFIWID